MSGFGSRDIRRAAVPRLIAANVLAAALTASAIELAEPSRAETRAWVLLAGQLVATVAIVGLLASVALYRGRARERRTWGWLDEDRMPSAAERELALAEPWRVAVEIFRLWLVGAALVGLAFLAGDGLGRSVVAAVTATILGGFTASTLSFFLAERALRQASALALAGAPPRGRVRLGVRRRILASWALGSGVPLAWIALVPVFRDPDSGFPLAFLTTLLAVSGVVAGAGVSYLTGGSVGGPVEEVRRGLERVQRGELAVNVTVDDAGELGLLQAGFNNMVEAVAERTRLEDLFGRHVGTDVARLALERGVELGGEVKEVSVLFVDVIGSASLTARLPPTEIVALLNRFFTAVVHCSAAEGGCVNKFEGDAALCIFGAPVPYHDHAARALRATRALQTALREIDVGIGVSAGDAVAGNVGTEARYEYTVIGQPVNEAARLVEQAKRREARVLASAAVVERAGEEAAFWSALGRIDLRGIPTGVEVYEPQPTEATKVAHRKRGTHDI